ncbi:MAG: thioredoxin domain-containing protein [Anaerolineales bacterium]|nr:thioredoxin domain-containing protein [Anaerolineales bacterium]
MPNHLANSNSPYLLQHQHNPVDWYPWGEEALERARLENKPIFLSIGYAACHWCHVMERESFEDQATAAMMNEHFINIKVDREERPDLDRIYMSAVVAITGQGGWPMSVFLTPSGKPFFGGTYFPPTRRYGMPSFIEVLNSVAAIWEEDPQGIEESGDKLTAHIRKNTQTPAPDDHPALDEAILNQAVSNLYSGYDWRNGGWGSAPKFPQAMTIQFLLRQANRGSKVSAELASHALEAMAKGGMYDLIGGGFARYSVDDRWLVPHFEKMLYDNALLASAYLHAWLVTGNPHFRQVCEETLDFVLREMTHSSGGFYSSIDADSEGEEGLFYLWQLAEIKSLLSGEEFEAFSQAYTLPEDGNFEGKIVLQRKVKPEELSPSEPILKSARKKLFTAREKRIRPATDDKILTAWNAWMSVAFAEAARYLNREDYLSAAQQNLTFLTTELMPGGTLLRSWREGTALHVAYLEDTASLILALLTLYQSDHNPHWYRIAAQLVGAMLDQFYEPESGFFDVSKHQDNLIVRPQESQDNATPSGASVAVQALLTIAAFSGEGRYYEIAAKTLSPLQNALSNYPSAFGNWLIGLDFALAKIQEVVIIGELDHPATQELIETLWQQFRPYLVLAASAYPPAESSPALLADRPQVDRQPTAYVCQNFICQQPVTSPDGLKRLLD